MARGCLGGRDDSECVVICVAAGLPQKKGLLHRICHQLSTARSQLEAKFYHASDFGVTEPRGAVGFEADEMAAALEFPYYFGGNRPAFNECTSDMDWLP
jgi:Barstar (barnase inhibitor)